METERNCVESEKYHRKEISFSCENLNAQKLQENELQNESIFLNGSFGVGKQPFASNDCNISETKLEVKGKAVFGVKQVKKDKQSRCCEYQSFQKSLEEFVGFESLSADVQEQREKRSNIKKWKEKVKKQSHDESDVDNKKDEPILNDLPDTHPSDSFQSEEIRVSQLMQGKRGEESEDYNDNILTNLSQEGSLWGISALENLHGVTLESKKCLISKEDERINQLPEENFDCSSFSDSNVEVSNTLQTENCMLPCEQADYVYSCFSMGKELANAENKSKDCNIQSPRNKLDPEWTSCIEVLCNPDLSNAEEEYLEDEQSIISSFDYGAIDDGKNNDECNHYEDTSDSIQRLEKENLIEQPRLEKDLDNHSGRFRHLKHTERFCNIDKEKMIRKSSINAETQAFFEEMKHKSENRLKVLEQASETPSSQPDADSQLIKKGLEIIEKLDVQLLQLEYKVDHGPDVNEDNVLPSALCYLRNERKRCRRHWRLKRTIESVEANQIQKKSCHFYRNLFLGPNARYYSLTPDEEVLVEQLLLREDFSEEETPDKCSTASFCSTGYDVEGEVALRLAEIDEKLEQFVENHMACGFSPSPSGSEKGSDTISSKRESDLKYLQSRDEKQLSTAIEDYLIEKRETREIQLQLEAINRKLRRLMLEDPTPPLCDEDLKCLINDSKMEQKLMA